MPNWEVAYILNTRKRNATNTRQNKTNTAKKEMVILLSQLHLNDVMSLPTLCFMSPVLLRLCVCVQCVGGVQSNMCYDRNLTCDG